MIRAWVLRLNDREKLLLAGGALLSLAILLYLIVWRPMTAEQSRLQEQVDRKQALVVWMRAATEEAKRLQQSGNPPLPSNKPLEQLIADHISRMRLKTERLTKSGDSEVTLFIDKAEFNQILQFMEQTSREGVRLVKADLHTAASPGRVNVQMTLSK
ncbi:type II secretion system protein GspM [Azotobacter armeniacus]